MIPLFLKATDGPLCFPNSIIKFFLTHCINLIKGSLGLVLKYQKLVFAV